MSQAISKKVAVILMVAAITLCLASPTLAADPTYWNDFKGMRGQGFVSYDGTPPFEWDNPGTPSDTFFKFDLRILPESGRQGIFNMECTEYTPNGVVKYRVRNAIVTIRESIFDEPYVFYLFSPHDSSFLQIRAAENVQVQVNSGPWINRESVNVICGKWFEGDIFRINNGYSDIYEDNVNSAFLLDDGWISAEYAEAKTEHFCDDFESGVLDKWQVMHSANGRYPSVTIDPLDASNHVACIGNNDNSMGPLSFASLYKQIAVADKEKSIPLLNLKLLVSGNDIGADNIIFIKVNDVKLELGKLTGGWQDFRYDLTDYKGQTITLGIGYSGDLNNEIVHVPCYVDDVKISYE